MQLAELSMHAVVRGVSSIAAPHAWLNGLLSPLPDGGAMAVDQHLGYAIMMEMQLMQVRHMSCVVTFVVT